MQRGEEVAHHGYRLTAPGRARRQPRLEESPAGVDALGNRGRRYGRRHRLTDPRLGQRHLDQPGLRAFLIGWIVIPYVVSGILAWWRRPASRLGPLMVPRASSMASPRCSGPTSRWCTASGISRHAAGRLFLHVFLAFPTGRLTSAERMVVVTCYATALGLQLVKVMLGANPDSVFALVDSRTTGNVVEQHPTQPGRRSASAGAVLLYLRQRSGAGRTVGRPYWWSTLSAWPW